jgi:hypothetical protein
LVCRSKYIRSGLQAQRREWRAYSAVERVETRVQFRILLKGGHFATGSFDGVRPPLPPAIL